MRLIKRRNKLFQLIRKEKRHWIVEGFSKKNDRDQSSEKTKKKKNTKLQ